MKKIEAKIGDAWKPTVTLNVFGSAVRIALNGDGTATFPPIGGETREVPDAPDVRPGHATLPNGEHLHVGGIAAMRCGGWFILDRVDHRPLNSVLGGRYARDYDVAWYDASPRGMDGRVHPSDGEWSGMDLIRVASRVELPEELRDSIERASVPAPARADREGEQ